MSETKITRESLVTLHYEVLLADNTVVDLEDCLLGLPVGEQTRILIPASEGFGYRTTEAIQNMPRSDFPPDLVPKPQQIIEFQTPTGESVPGMVLEVTDETVQVDFNHPLAGHDIQFIVHILDVKNPQDEGKDDEEEA